MTLHPLDLAIIFAYLASIVAIGFLLRRRARENKGSYLLGGNRVSWPMLGLSNASSMFDISGTIWLVTLLFVYGLKSVWIPWLWPVFNQIFLMVFLSIWIRRSGVATGAQWLETRFGTGRDGERAHRVMVVFAILLGVGGLTYGFVGMGKFVEVFLPWEIVSPYLPFDLPPQHVAHFYGLAFTLVAILYTILGGMLSIVWADLVQFAIMASSAIVIGVTAMVALQDASLPVPEGWRSLSFGWDLGLDWSRKLPEVDDRIARDGFEPFGFFFTMMLIKGMLASMAGPAPTSDLQKILSTRSPREAALMSASVSVFLMPIRYFMIGGFAIMGLLYFHQLELSASGRLDLEQILPAVIQRFFPTGLLGLLLAGFLAAFMSTFSATLNAAQAYVVNDLLLRHRTASGSKQIGHIAWGSGLALALCSVAFGLVVEDVNDVLQWIVSGLFGSYLASNLLKWYWWRFNGAGFFWGMVGGLIPALTFRFVFDGALDLYTFPLLLLIALAACLLGTYTAPPTDSQTLQRFYRTVRPWGFWGPVKKAVMANDPSFRPCDRFKRDAASIAVGVVWQTALVAAPLFFILGMTRATVLSIGVIALTSWALKRFWYDHLPNA